MKAIEPALASGEVLVRYAENQAEYETLPAARNRAGAIATEWEFSARDLETLLNGGRLRIQILTFNQPLQPMRVNVVGRNGEIID